MNKSVQAYIPRSHLCKALNEAPDHSESVRDVQLWVKDSHVSFNPSKISELEVRLSLFNPGIL